MNTKNLSTFTVFFTGEVLPSVPFEVAKARFMEKFNISSERMEQLIEFVARENFPLKRGVSAEDAKKWEHHIEWCGFKCKLAPENLSLGIGQSVFDELEEVDPSTIERWTTCPQCYTRQDARNKRCQECNAKLDNEY